MYVRLSSGQRIEDLLADPANAALWEALAPLGIYADQKWK
jgi:hypothetical protein